MHLLCSDNKFQIKTRTAPKKLAQSYAYKWQSTVRKKLLLQALFISCQDLGRIRPEFFFPVK